MQRKWTDEWNYYLLTVPAKHWRIVWPENTQDALHTRKKKLKRDIEAGAKKMPEQPPDFNPEQTPEELHDRLHDEERARKIGELLNRAGVEPEDIARIKRVNLYQMGYKDADGEAQVKDLISVSYEPKEDIEALESHYTPIEPAIIHPTTKERPARNSKLILVFGDGQVDYRRRIDPVTDEMEMIPLHDEAMHRVLQQINAELMPETIVNLGDFADMSSLSKFAADSDHFHKTLGPALRYIHDFYAQLRCDNPDSHIVETDSNHAIRPKKKVLNDLPALYDFVIPGEDYPMISYYRMANLGKLEIDFISGYGAAEFVYGEEYDAPPIVFKHGTIVSSVPGATVSKESKENPEVHMIRGHGHHDEEVRRTTRSGRQLIYKMLGSSCLNNGPVPGYDSAVDDFNRPVKKTTKHQNTFAIIEDFMNGHYTMTTIDVINGKAYYQGKEYDGNGEL